MLTASSSVVFRWSAVPLCGLAVLCGASVAQAEPVRVTDGALIGDNFGVTLSATGDRSLAILARGDKTGGRYGPAQCLPCFPGDRVDIDSGWSGSDFTGVVSIDDRTFAVDIGTGTTGSLLAAFEGGSVLLPDFAGPPLAVLSTPFSFHGFLYYPFAPGVDHERETLIGGGTATVQYEWNPLVRSWDLSAARYEFSPVPEPASVSLLALSLAALGFRRSRQTGKDS